MDEETEPIVIDHGSGFIKAGFANDDAPKHVFPAVIGTPKSPGIMIGMDQKDSYIGKEALQKKNNLILSEPIQQGILTDFDEMRKIWKHLWNDELTVNPDSYSMMITEPPKNDKKIREQLCKIMFEEYYVPKLYIGVQAVLSLFASGKTTGTVVDCGYGISHTVPIYEGYAIPHAIQEIPLAGRDLDNRMLDLLVEKGYSFTTSSGNKDKITEIKEKNCLVAQDFDAEMKQALENSHAKKTYTVNGTEIELTAETIKCPEYLFQPSQGNKEIEGIHKFTYDSIVKCDQDIKMDLFQGIVLAGGSTMFYGMKERMKKEIQALAPSPMSPEVNAPADRKYSCWLGGAILSKIDLFDKIWITKNEYEEFSETIVHRKCF